MAKVEPLNIEPGDIKPGDLISAQVINWILQRVTDLEAELVGSGGPIVVPNLFSQTIGNVKLILSQPAFQLLVGIVFDTFGTLVDPFSTDFDARLILSQSPPPGTRVPANTGIALVVAAKLGGNVPAAEKPQVTSFEPTKQRIDEPVKIKGVHFAPFPNQNIVRFGGVAVTPTQGNAIELVARIPKGIPGAPLVGTNQELEIDVIVISAGGGPSDAVKLVIQAPLSTPAPKITEISPAIGVENIDVIIKGDNFGATNTVMFDDKSIAGVTGTQTQLTVKIPTFNLSSSQFKLVSVKVRAGDQESDPFNYQVWGA